MCARSRVGALSSDVVGGMELLLYICSHSSWECVCEVE